VKWLRTGRNNFLPCNIPVSSSLFHHRCPSPSLPQEIFFFPQGYRKKNQIRKQEDEPAPALQALAEKLSETRGRRSQSSESFDSKSKQPDLVSSKRVDQPPGQIVFNTGLFSKPCISVAPEHGASQKEARLFPLYSLSAGQGNPFARLSETDMMALLYGRRQPHGYCYLPKLHFLFVNPCLSSEIFLFFSSFV